MCACLLARASTDDGAASVPPCARDADADRASTPPLAARQPSSSAPLPLSHPPYFHKLRRHASARVCLWRFDQRQLPPHRHERTTPPPKKKPQPPRQNTTIMAELLRALAFKLNGPKFHNAAFGEALWEVACRATTRHIENPDEMLNQQVRRGRGRSWGRGGGGGRCRCTLSLSLSVAQQHRRDLKTTTHGHAVVAAVKVDGGASTARKRPRDGTAADADRAPPIARRRRASEPPPRPNRRAPSAHACTRN